MVQAIRQEITVEKDSIIEIHSPILKSGDHVEVIILVEANLSLHCQSLSSLLGRGKGSFKSSEEADTFIRNERDGWR